MEQAEVSEDLQLLADFVAHVAAFWSAAARRRFALLAGNRNPSRLPVVYGVHDEVIHDLHAVGTNPHDRLIEGALRLPLEPARRPPRIFTRLPPQSTSPG